MRLPKGTNSLCRGLVLFSVLWCPLVSSAGVVVVPGEYATSEANSSDTAPLGASGERFQQVFGTALLSGLHVGDQIVGLTFRVNGGESELPAQTIPDFEVRLSQSRSAPGSLSATLADNRGADEIVVRSGPLTIQPGGFPGGASPNGFGSTISFATPYTYKGGNLLLEVAYQPFPNGSRNADAVYPYSSALAQTAFGAGFNATQADDGLYGEAIVTQFTVAPIPEPAGSAAVAAGLLAVLVAGRRPARGKGWRTHAGG